MKPPLLPHQHASAAARLCPAGAAIVLSACLLGAGCASNRANFVWLPMLPTDNESEASRMARSMASSRAWHFYDPPRRVGIALVEDHFHDFMREALAALPEEHPLRERLARRVSAPASESPLWDAVLFFAPGVEWSTKSPRPDWWTKQIAFYGTGERGKPTGRFWRSQSKDGPVESDWYAEAREVRTLIRPRISP